ncbi:hypothetical protein ACHAWU_004633 [Discostella pseudostelligera]|uniref:RRM domain-containing protein n=1 Tax=Discostella pseudostelligera TaxID=259834 RepID=A0ABD3MAN9_9STRA
MNFQQKKRAMTPKGQMSGNGSGPAIMMMPPHIRATFMPDPPLKHLPAYTRHVLVSENYITDDDDDNNDSANNVRGRRNDMIKTENIAIKTESKVTAAGPSGITTIPTSFPKLKRGAGLSGVSTFLRHFEQTPPPPRKIDPTPASIREAKRIAAKAANDEKLAPLIEKYRQEQRECSGEFTNGMNCYNTLFVGRLAYEVTERKLLRELEVYGPIKDIKLVTDTTSGKSRGYAFVEYEHEEDMKRAYRAADGMRLEGRAIVVDVERGHTVPNWLPRKFGGGLGGGSRVGGPSNRNAGAGGSGGGGGGMMGRFDPMSNGGGGGGGRMMGQPPQPMGGPGGPGPMMGGGGGGPPAPMYGRPPMSGRGGGPPPPSYGGGGGGGGYGDRGGGGGYYGGPPPSYGDRGGGGYRDSRGPPPPASGPYGGGGVGYNNGPPPLAWERGDGAGGGGGSSARGYDGDRKRRRSRSRSPDNRRRW